ncbi:MAG: hypothetical protein IKQ09_01375 [Bacteroidales bacterium]|nr:hypothetical protein [Bacteroidales bacterium]
MNNNNPKQFSFAADLKASNIEVNAVSLDEYAKQIELLLEQIDTGDKVVSKKNVESATEAINESLKSSPINKLNEYIKLGEILLFLIADIKENNIDYMKQIAICYLDIAKLANDEKVKRLSFAIADKLIQNDDK